ncbi:PH domain-containing protein [Candidatus Latescibacterota bacterium]
MEPLNISPRKEHKNVWMISWTITFSIIALPLVAAVIFIPDTAGKIVFGVFLSIFTVSMMLTRIWYPVFFKSIEYGIDNDTVKMNCGVFFKKRVTVPFQKITNVDISQGPLERKYNIGKIHVQTAGAGGAQGAQAELRFSGIRDLDELKDRIMDGVRGHVAAPSAVNTRDEASEMSLLKDILNELKAMRTILGDK